MATEFVAKQLDLDLQLTTLKGEEILIEPKEFLTTKKCVELMKQFQEFEKDTDKTIYEQIGIELSMIYPKSAEWFLENFEPGTLSEIMKHIGQTIAGAKKNLKK